MPRPEKPPRLVKRGNTYHVMHKNRTFSTETDDETKANRVLEQYKAGLA